MILLILVLSFFAFCAFIATAINVLYRHSEKEILRREQPHESYRWYAQMPKETYTVSGYADYPLHTEYLPAEGESDRFVIIVHGYAYNRLGSLKYAELFHKHGFHCIIYDNRGHGLNRKTYCTFGIRESRDLMAVIEDTYRRYGPDIHIGLHGESMGTGTVLALLQYQPNIDFAVCDCGFGDLEPVLKNKLWQNMRAPAWLLKPVSAVNRLLYGFSYRKVKPIQYLPDNRIPLCFMHGTADDYIDVSQSKAMYEANGGYGELHLYPGAGHAMALLSDPARYETELFEFVEKVPG